MIKKVLAVALLAGAAAFGADVSVGIRIGPPPPPRVEHTRPAIPGAGFAWIEGYWYPVGKHYKWHEGYWTRPPYQGAIWVGPRHEGEQYHNGYWQGPRGPMEHNHQWDRDRRRRDWDHDGDRH